MSAPARFERDRLATAMRVRLVEARRQDPNRSFESAWSHAWRDLGPGADWRAALDATKDAFRLAYYRQGGGKASLLTEREGGRIIDFPREPVLTAGRRRCGSGSGCTGVCGSKSVTTNKPLKYGPKGAQIIVQRYRPAPAYLCPTHLLEIRLALGSSEYRGKDETTFGDLAVAA